MRAVVVFFVRVLRHVVVWTSDLSKRLSSHVGGTRIRGRLLSVHMLTKTDLSSDELDAFRKSRNPTTVIAVNGEVQTTEKCTKDESCSEVACARRPMFSCCLHRARFVCISHDSTTSNECHCKTA